jgi:hypothetical protein
LGELLDPEEVLEYVLVGLEHVLRGFARVPHLTHKGQLSILPRDKIKTLIFVCRSDV